MLFDKLTDKDKQLIESYLDRYACNPCSNLYRTPISLQDRLLEWDNTKNEYLYKLFGEKFILEKQIEYIESNSSIKSKLFDSRNKDGKMRKFYKNYTDWVHSLGWGYWSDDFSLICDLIEPHCLCEEKIGNNTSLSNLLPRTLDFGNGNKIKIESSSKPMRVLGKIVKMCDLDAEAFEEFRIEHSRILNTKKMTGTLCLSIHPLDYMTMSMNKEKWSSCMNWSEPGCYRGGTVELMNSEMTLVAYLKSDKNTFSWDYEQEWNSKKWRILITVSPSAILAIKGYPYHHEQITHKALEWVSELAANNLNQYYAKPQKIDACTTFLNKETNQWYNIDLKDGAMMYNDWGSDIHYGCMTLNPEDRETSEENPNNLYIDYCGDMTCLCCGRKGDNYYNESYVICDDCSSDEENGYYCEECGEWVSEEDALWINGHCYCDYCVYNVGETCKIDGSLYFYSELEQVYLAKEEDHPNPKEDSYIYLHNLYCSSGEQYWKIPKEYSNIEKPRYDKDNNLYYFNANDLTSDGYCDLYHFYCEAEINEYFEK